MTPQESFENTYQTLEKLIIDLNMSAAEAEKEQPEEAETLRALAEDTFEILKKVAVKVSGCAGCSGCSHKS